MNLTRNGKIARLPRTIRQELNRRLLDVEQGKTLVAWLKRTARSSGHQGRGIGGLFSYPTGNLKAYSALWWKKTVRATCPISPARTAGPSPSSGLRCNKDPFTSQRP